MELGAEERGAEEATTRMLASAASARRPLLHSRNDSLGGQRTGKLDKRHADKLHWVDARTSR